MPDDFIRPNNVVPYDDGEFDIAESYPLQEEVAWAEGWDDPNLDVYAEWEQANEQ